MPAVVLISELLHLYLTDASKVERESRIEDLKERIEVLRVKMYKTYENNPNDPQLITISQSLDKLLNELERTTQNEEK
ncbi:aspartyl-phosphate phosphatase Spo0E family protein [Halobacillus ihumii]|uniref:aspartyl-phosphate phosphatase Spo0E family protein n=1 Tax=Halobacillus ihumii TaxID=2686092 RepID=UPI001F07B9A6|nr:aspartyl-phosphate phosphatase Spo0E family protein [Halobacillus ihumii]